MKKFEEFQFVPKILVSNICKIYINLGDYDNFCLAVSQDGRSYSHELFEQAEVVLCKIHDPLDRISRLNEISMKIKVSEFKCSQPQPTQFGFVTWLHRRRTNRVLPFETDCLAGVIVFTVVKLEHDGRQSSCNGNTARTW